MPGARSTFRPAPASENSVSDEACQLELYLQRQLEEDVARIFDESIYSDFEVVCGKLKILTHSCILKARTNNFYHKLETILHANIGQSTFDEIYSFISDAYTECNIKYQEKEIITYLEDNLDVVKPATKHCFNNKPDSDETDVYLTPKCETPDTNKKFIPSSTTNYNDLTKEYYALVPVEKNLLDKELNEQDALSNAFQSIIKSQTADISEKKLLQRNKPTSLSLTSSHLSKPIKHSNSCDILNKHLIDKCVSEILNQADKVVNKSYTRQLSNIDVTVKSLIDSVEREKTCGSSVNKELDSACSPDSLITDDQSSSSDYLSAALVYSPGVSTSGGVTALNVENIITKMDNTFTSLDSGLENTGMLESLNSHKDITVTDVSLTESALHDLTADEINDSVSNSYADNNLQRLKYVTPSSVAGGSSSEKDTGVSICSQSLKIKDNVDIKTSKEEKQRKNEEIVILESSSLSSEAGSWESYFPPKSAEKEICAKFISNERNHTNLRSKDKNEEASNSIENVSLFQKLPFKSTSCFIDAASLVDEDDDKISDNARSDVLLAPSQPLPCSTAKFDASPNDCSESNENEDSLEQDDKDPDSIQKDISPTIFEMTPITEDSLSNNCFENALQAEKDKKELSTEKSPDCSNKKESSFSNTILVSSTPHNSIMALKVSALNKYEFEDSESDTATVSREKYSINTKKVMKYNESSPIVSGGASIEDHLPQLTSHSESPLTRRKVENIPIVSGAYTPYVEENEKKSSKPPSASAWIVYMSNSPKSDAEKSNTSAAGAGSINKKPGDKTCELLRNGSKSSLDSFSSLENRSRVSVDSDGSEKSSHKFYIDLSSLPDPTPPKNNECEKSNEKKNIFSMFIDLGDKPAKEMPARLSLSLHSRKNVTEPKPATKSRTIEKPDVSSSDNFAKYESLCNDPNINISEIINIIENTDTNTDNVFVKESCAVGENNNCDRVTATTSEKKTATAECTDLFVRLSDLDKPILKTDSPAVITEEKVLDVRMTRSIPDKTWGDQSKSCTSRSIEVISSFHSENTMSLNRLFPHLKNEFSRSMPGALSGRTRSPLTAGAPSSPGETEEHGSDMSDVSSMQSSMCRSVIENSTTEDTSQTSSLIGNCQSRLGQDLLRMFLQEIAPDVIVEVSGRRIKAHKCILSSRCQYFAGILSGGWVESAGNVIVLPPFSYNVVHFVLCHIYSGLSTIPDSISIVELATIADMLGLEGLKEAIMFTLKAKYCHHFHRPCQVCTAGVLECFPLSSVYGLDDLYHKCLKWITKYFFKIWPTKAFATLPKELLDKCYQQHIVNLTIDNLVDTVYGCGVTVASLQNSRWSESVARMCRRLVNAAAHHAAPRLVAALHAFGPLPPDAPPPARQALLDCLAAAIEWAPPEEACRAYSFLSSVVKEIRSQQYCKPDLISNGNTNKLSAQNSLLYTNAANWRQQTEGVLVRAAPRVVGTQAFKDLPPDLRKRLRELGCIMYGAQPVPISTTSSPDRKIQVRSTFSVKNRALNTAPITHSLDIDHMRASFVPYSSKPAPSLGSVEVIKSNNDIRESKDWKSKGSSNPPKIRSTKAQEERAKYNLSKNNKSQDPLSTIKAAAPRMSFENAKPRYLEPKAQKEPGKRMSTTRKLVPKMVSSSESSRNSSPILARNLRASKFKCREGMVAESPVPAISQDSLATSPRPRTTEPSTDSLSESQKSNKYATYTKMKHTTGSIESVNKLKSPNTLQAYTSGNNKTKTKIPISLNHVSKLNNGDSKHESQKRFTSNGRSAASMSMSSTNGPPRGKPTERKTGSLMNATKASSAKMVPKIVKDPINKTSPKYSKKTTQGNQSVQQKPPDIPVMERSGTFLKDEPTFGDKTTNIDIDQ